MIELLRKQKAEALNYWKQSGDKNVRAEMRKLDKMIRRELINERCNNANG